MRIVRETEVPASTKDLLHAAGLENDPHGGRGALKMAEVLGLVHASRGKRKTLCWRGGPGPVGDERRRGLPELLAFRRLRDLLQHYRGSLIGTPDLLRDSEVANQREALGALKLLHLCGLVEIGKLNVQTVAWRWIGGRGQSRTYQRGYFRRAAEAEVLEGDAVCHGEVRRRPWIHKIIHDEWLLQAQADGFGEVAQTDGRLRYRPQTAADEAFGNVLLDALRQMPDRLRCGLVATLLRGWSPEEAAEVIGVSVSTLRRDTKTGLERLRCVLTEAGFAPPHKPARCSRDHPGRCA